MARGSNKLSLLSHTPDRGTYVAYFLGAIVPLVALGVALERYVFRGAIESGSFALSHAQVLALFTAITGLSLLSFVLLRRVVSASIDENKTLAYYDSLTGLPNRRMYEERLRLALARATLEGKIVAVCFLDLDGFKRINDTLGHSHGDQLLSEVAARLLDAVRISDTVSRSKQGTEQASVSRLGGDEFTLLLTGISTPQDAGRIARRILEALRAPFSIGTHEILVTSSLGIAVSPLDGDCADALLANADTAMYAAKAGGRNNYRFYDRSMNAEAARKLEIEQRLRVALGSDALTLHYQPVRHAVTGELSGVEALLRWHDPVLGSVPPDEFVPVAEDAGLIVPMGFWVMKTACAQARAWQDAGYRAIRMAVNLSGHQIRDSEFVERVEEILRETGLAATWLELEITESTIMQKDELTDRAFWALDHMGIGLALDDFGTGYSSMSYLRRFPVRRLKIDRSFVAKIPDDPEDVTIAAAIVAMARNLLLSVVGEGVETEAQAQSLRELGCEEIQGYLISPPVSAEKFTRFLEREKQE